MTTPVSPDMPLRQWTSKGWVFLEDEPPEEGDLIFVDENLGLDDALDEDPSE